MSQDASIDQRFAERLASLTPTQFENFAFDLLRERGLENIYWRSPGADGGRDIEGYYYAKDFSGVANSQKWYIECKHYSSSINWPLIFEKLSYARNHNADFLLLITSAKFSTQAVSESQTWNARNQLQIRLWPVNELYAVAAQYPNILAKYSLSDAHDSLKLPFLNLVENITTLMAAAEGRELITNDRELSEEAKIAKELSILAMVRLRQLENEGKISIQKISEQHKVDFPDNYVVNMLDDPFIDLPGLMAFLHYWKFLTKQESASLSIVKKECKFPIAVNGFSVEMKSKLEPIALWANFEYVIDNGNLIIMQREFPF